MVGYINNANESIKKINLKKKLIILSLPAVLLPLIMNGIGFESGSFSQEMETVERVKKWEEAALNDVENSENEVMEELNGSEVEPINRIVGNDFENPAEIISTVSENDSHAVAQEIPLSSKEVIIPKSNGNESYIENISRKKLKIENLEKMIEELQSEMSDENRKVPNLEDENEKLKGDIFKLKSQMEGLKSRLVEMGDTLRFSADKMVPCNKEDGGCKYKIELEYQLHLKECKRCKVELLRDNDRKVRNAKYFYSEKEKIHYITGPKLTRELDKYVIIHTLGECRKISKWYIKGTKNLRSKGNGSDIFISYDLDKVKEAFGEGNCLTKTDRNY